MPGNNRNHGHWSMVPSLNYIENILIYNFEIQCERHFCRRRPKNISKFFIFPDIDAPLYVVKTSLSPYNSHLPLSIFYQTGKSFFYFFIFFFFKNNNNNNNSILYILYHNKLTYNFIFIIYIYKYFNV